MISERRHAILGLIIEHYLRTGEPIGSKTLCQLLPYSISSATIRNEMAYLTQLGFLEQRHTSGGRVPSKASYRYYVDNIMKPKELTGEDIEKILGGEAKVNYQKISFSEKQLQKYFPPDYKKEQIEKIIFQLLDSWKAQTERRG